MPVFKPFETGRDLVVVCGLSASPSDFRDVIAYHFRRWKTGGSLLMKFPGWNLALYSLEEWEICYRSLTMGGRRWMEFLVRDDEG